MINIQIEDLDLSIQSYYGLKRLNINNLKELVSVSEKYLIKSGILKICNINEIKEKLTNLKLYLLNEDLQQIN